MKKIFILFLCVLLSLQTFAADIEITEDFSVKVDKEALLAALYEADIVSIREAIDLKLITCYELTAYYLERIEAYNDTFQCFITLCDNALDVAQQRDEAIANGTAQGKLFGIPIVVKDNIDYEGYPTTNGLSTPKKGVKDSATVVQYLIDEGAVILGKTNMSAAAEDALCSINAAGLQTFNAYNPSLSAGGSSGGSAVAVSLNFAVAGLGTDTNSSLRYPASLNGCISLRTTFGLIDREGCVILNYSRDTVGAITRSVADQAIMLDVMTADTYRFTDNLDANALQGLRIGVLSELSYPIENSYNRKESDLDDEIQTAFDNAVSELTACGAEIVTVSVPSILNDIENNNNLYKKLEKILNDNNISALIYPAYLHTPHYTTQEYLKGKSIYSLPYITNCNTLSSRTGAPEITVPIGRHSLGAGIGMEIISFKSNDQLLLDIAYSYTSQFDHRQAPQTAPSLHFGESENTLQNFLQLYKQSLEDAIELQHSPTELHTQSTSQTGSEEGIEATDSAAQNNATESHDDSIESKKDQPTKWYYIATLVLLVFTCSAFYLIRRNKKNTLSPKNEVTPKS